MTVGLGALGLEYILQNGGSGYFPIRVVQPHIDQRKLFRLEGAPSVQRPVYMVYPSSADDPESLEFGLRGLREIVDSEVV